MLSIVNYLKENGITVPVTIGSVVDGDGVGLFSTSGLKPTYYFGNDLTTYEGLQVIARNKSYLEGEEIINNIFTLLNGLDGYEGQQKPFYIGRDEKKRAEFSVNFIITR